MKILVTSYKNPDLDGVACTYAYTEFLYATCKDVLGAISGSPHMEAQFVLDKFNIPSLENAEKIINAIEQIILVDTSDIKSLSDQIQSHKVIEIIDHRKVNEANKFPNAKIQIDLVGAASTLIAEGTLRTGYVRYNTLELKIFKLMQARVDTANGGLYIDSIDYADNFFRIGTFAQESNVPEININYPQASQEYLGFQFTLTRSSSDVTKGPLFTGYQIKALPAIPRQRLIQYPLSCFDHESDHFGVEVGFEGSAYDRMSQLESIENVGDTIRVEDFRTGESYIGLIEELDFINKTPSDKRFSGYGGLLLVTIRSV